MYLNLCHYLIFFDRRGSEPVPVATMSESLLQTDDVQSMSVTDLAVYFEANGICEDEAHELASKLA